MQLENWEMDREKDSIDQYEAWWSTWSHSRDGFSTSNNVRFFRIQSSSPLDRVTHFFFLFFSFLFFSLVFSFFLYLFSILCFSYWVFFLVTKQQNHSCYKNGNNPKVYVEVKAFLLLLSHMPPGATAPGSLVCILALSLMRVFDCWPVCFTKVGSYHTCSLLCLLHCTTSCEPGGVCRATQSSVTTSPIPYVPRPPLSTN